MRAELLIMLSAAVACREPARIESGAPGDIAAVAVLTLDAAGAPIGNAELLAWSENAALPISAETSAHAVLAGYTRAQLAIYFGDAAPHGTVRGALGCDPRLPAPAWFARWTREDALETADPADAPPLTAGFAEGRCPDRAGAVIDVDLRCEAPRCPSTLASAGTCREQLDLTACGLGLSTLTIDAAGTACLEPSTPPDDCEIDVYVAANAATPPFELDELRFFGEEPYLPENARTKGVISSAARFSGRAYDFALLDTELVVAASPDGVGRPPCPDDQPPANEALYFVDPDTMTTTATAVAPRCLQRILRDEDRGGFLASFERAGSWAIGRFDARGLLEQEASTEIPFDYRRVNELAYAGLDRILVLANVAAGATLVALHHRATLAHLETIELAEFNAHALAMIDDRTVALLASDALAIAWLDLEAHAIVDRQDIPPNLARNWGFYGAAADRGAVLIAARGEAEMYRFRMGATMFERARLSGGEGAELSLVPWPSDQGLWLAGGADLPDFSASVTLFDANAMRFRPGRWRVGEGVVGRMRADRAGKIWALLPWAGKLVRLTPR